MVGTSCIKWRLSHWLLPRFIPSELLLARLLSCIRVQAWAFWVSWEGQVSDTIENHPGTSEWWGMYTVYSGQWPCYCGTLELPSIRSSVRNFNLFSSIVGSVSRSVTHATGRQYSHFASSRTFLSFTDVWLQRSPLVIIQLGPHEHSAQRLWWMPSNLSSIV